MNKRKKTYRGGGKYPPQYFLGGSLKKILPAAAGAATSFIPGVGPALAPVASAAVGAAVNSGGEEEGQQFIEKNASTSYGKAQGGAINPLGQNALAFAGPSHEGGGIQIPNAEVEGGETMDFIEFKNGGMIDARDGSPYVFSKRLKLPDSSATFADAHKRLVKDNANEQEIKELAMLQEKVSGRSNSSEGSNNLQNGGQPDPPYGSDFDWLGNDIRQIFGQNTNPNAKIPAPNEGPLMSNPILGSAEGAARNVGFPTSDPSVPSQPLPGLGGGPMPEDQGEPGFVGLPQNNKPNPLLQNQQDLSFYESLTPQQKKQVKSANQKPSGSQQSQGQQKTTPEVDRSDNIEAATLSQTPSLTDMGAEPFVAPVDQSGSNIESASLNQGEVGSTEASGALASGEVPGTDGAGGEEGMSDGMSTALQFVPEILNFATGALSEPDTPEPTRVSNRSVRDMPERINVNPQLLRNAQNYRAILADPNATATQKMAAQAQKQQADAQVFANKLNRENQMQANKARLQAGLDRNNAQFANQARTEEMKADAMFGPTGNMARNAIGSASQKMLMQQAQKNKKKQNEKEVMAIMSQLDPALQEKFAKQLGLLQ